MQKIINGNRCVIYARYSCSNQTEQSIEGQLHDCERFAAGHDLRVVHTYIDRAMTATSDRRPEFQRMVKDSAKHLFDMVLVWKLDRFSRNRYDSAIYKSKLKKNGVRVISVTENISDTPEGILMESILEGYAEYYSAELGQKVRRGMRETAAKGRITGHVPFGYKVSENNTYEIDPVNAYAVQKIFEMYIDRMTHKEISVWLVKNGYKTSYGNEFTPQAIRNVLTRKRYTGTYTYADAVFHDESQRIVDDKTYATAQRLLESNRKEGARHKAQMQYLLYGKLFCAKCRKMMHGECGRGGNGTKYYYYKCTKRKKQGTCDKKSIPKDYIEDYIIDNILNNVLNTELTDKIIDTIMKIQASAKEPPEITLLKSSLTEVEKRIGNLLNAIEQGVITTSTKNRLKELEDKQASIKAELAEAEMNNIKVSRSELQLFFKDLKSIDIKDYSSKRTLVDTFVNKILLWDDKIIIIYNFTPMLDSKNKLPEDELNNIIKTVSERSDTVISGSPTVSLSEHLYIHKLFLIYFAGTNI